jgi:hypothetical protein
MKIKNKKGTTLTELLVSISILALLLGLLLGAAQAVRDSANYVEHLSWLRQRRLDDQPHRKNLRVVFVGNSRLYYFDTPGIVVEFAKKIGTTVDAKVIVQGGQNLQGHWENGFAQNAIESRWNDFVILQEKGYDQYDQPDIYQEYVTKFTKLCKNDTAVLLMVNWYIPSDFQCIDKLISEVVKAINNSDNKGSEILASGEAFRSAMTERPDINLFLDDGHPNEIGAYYSACFLHAVMHRVSPLGLPNEVTTEDGTTVRISPSTAEYLQNKAWKVAEKFRRDHKPYYLKSK